MHRDLENHMVLPCADDEGYYESIAPPHEEDPDEAYDRQRQAEIDDEAERKRKLHDAGTTITYGTEPCPYCKGHGADPLSDNVNWLPCGECRGSGRIPKRRKP